MLVRQRQASILEEVNRLGGARIADLGPSFGVSDVTARRDIDALAGQGLVARVRGGALAVTRAGDEPSFALKSMRQQAEKDAIGRAAAALVRPGQAIGVSAGTTTAAAARHLLDCPGITVVTNSVPVADVFHRGGRPDQTVVLIGGTRTPSGALVGPVAQAALARVNLDVVLLGVHGMDERTGFTSPSFVEADTCRALVTAARQVVVIADHTKWGLFGIATVAPLDCATVLVTDSGLGEQARAVLRDRIGDLIAVDVAAGPDTAPPDPCRHRPGRARPTGPYAAR